MLGRDGIAGLICLAISLVLLILSFGLPQMPLVPVGPGFYPRIVLIGMAILSVALLTQDWRARRPAATTPASADEGGRTRPDYGLVLLSFVVFGAYVLLLPLLGYRIATVLFVAALQALLEPPATARGWLLLAVIAIATSALTYLVFERYLSVLLPRGAWTGW
jgi:hypothetical protein